MTASDRVGIVVIGRNEGARLTRCLASLDIAKRPVVYVDSCSSDGSAARARATGALVVELDPHEPLSAARARNSGVEALLERWPALEHVQCLDGDMQLAPDWIARASACLELNPDWVAVSGVRRELEPTRNLFHRIADVEWQSASFGDCEAFGGDVMLRIRAFRAVGGYQPDVVAAEDDELALRLRQRGGRIVRLNLPSAFHDIANDSFAAWWRRAMRTGHAYAQVGALHADSGHWARERWRVVAWGLAIPCVVLALATPAPLAAAAAALLLPLQMLRIAALTHRTRSAWLDCLAWGFHCSFGKVPQALGMLRFYFARLRGRGPRLLEDRSSPSPRDGGAGR